MKRNWKILLLTGILLVVVILLAVNLYHSNKEEVLSQFREHQLVHAQHIAIQIESFFLFQSSRLQELSGIILGHNDDIGKIRLHLRDHLQTFHEQMEGAHVEGILLEDELGSIISHGDPNMIRMIQAKSESFIWAKKNENRGKVFILPLSEEQPFSVVLAIALYREGSGREKELNPREKFVGIIYLIVDLGGFLTAQPASVKPEKKLHRVWIMDRDGKLIFHSGHPGVFPRNIFSRDKGCGQCHSSFGYAERILKEKQGIVEYKLENGSEKIAAFAPMQFENASWVIVVDSPLDRVTAPAWKSLQGYLVLGT
jgi:hypothetical protein